MKAKDGSWGLKLQIYDDSLSERTNGLLFWIKLMLFFDFFSVALVVPLMSSYFRSAGMDSKLWGYTSSTYQIAQLLGGVVMGALSDIISKRAVLIISFAGSAVSYLLVGLSKSAFVLLGSRALVGLVKQTMTVSTAAVQELVDGDDDIRTKQLGQISAIARVSFIIGPGLGSFLFKIDPFIPCLAAGAIFGINIAIAGIFMPAVLSNLNGDISQRDEKNSDVGGSNEASNAAGPWSAIKRFGNSLSSLIQLPNVGIILIFRMTISFVENSMSSRHILNYFEDRFGIETFQLGYVQSFTMAVSILSELYLLPKLLQFFKDKNSFHVVSFLLVGLGATNFLEYISPSYYVYVGISLLPATVLSSLLSFKMQQIFLHRIPVNETGKALGVIGVTSSVIGILSPIYANVALSPESPRTVLNGTFTLTRPLYATIHFVVLGCAAIILSSKEDKEKKKTE